MGEKSSPPSPPESLKKREIYMSSLEVHESIATDNIVIGHDPPKHGAFMATMAQLRPGPSEIQRIREKEQKQRLRNELEMQVRERREGGGEVRTVMYVYPNKTTGS